MDAVLASLSTAIVTFAAAHAWVAGLLMVLTVIRAINKPLFSLIHSLDESAGLTSFDAQVTAVEKSKVYTYFCYVLDYAFSIKVGTQAPAAVAAKAIAAAQPAPASTSTPAA